MQLFEELDNSLDTIVRHVLHNGEVARALSDEELAVLARLDVKGFQFVLVKLPPKLTKRLTRQESRVAVLVGEGLGSRGIAKRLGLSTRRVEHIIAQVKRKWDVSSRAAIGRYGRLSCAQLCAREQ